MTMKTWGIEGGARFEILDSIARSNANAALALLATYLPLSGGNMTGNIIINNSNSYLGLQDTDGKIAYFQTYNDGSSDPSVSAYAPL